MKVGPFILACFQEEVNILDKTVMTVTMNPAIDIQYVVPDFSPGRWFQASEVDRSAGGKGVNVSIILQQLGYESAAMGFLAGFCGEYVRDTLRRLKLTTNFVNVIGESRTNVYIVDEVGRIETGVTEPGPYISDESLGRFMKNYERMLSRARLVYLGGSLPPGVPQDAYKDLILHCEEAKVPVFIDASGPALTAALEARPMVVKFNHRFLLSTLGYPMGSLDDILNFVSKIHDNGIEWSVTTYGTVGNIFYTPQGIYLVDIGREEKEQMVSLLAIDDALMAGLAVALLEEMDVELAVRFAQACALEDTLHVRKGIRGRSMVESLVPKIMVEKLA